jgi:FRG domain
MSAWAIFLQEVKKSQSSFNLGTGPGNTTFFRGQSDSSWGLLPGISRYRWRHHSSNEEESLYFNFITEAGALLPENNSSWANIFFMQHHGLPTRLLDWSETFSVALYFAIKDANTEAAIWILDPYELNKRTINRNEVIHPTDLAHDYNAYYIARTAKLEGEVVAMSPLRHNPRVFHQRAGFTLHDNIEISLEALYPDVVKKISLKKEAFPEAWEFLDLAGISEFTLFPDLDGLSRELKRQHFR